MKGLPNVGIGGTGRDALIYQRCEIAAKLRESIEVLAQGAPNMRDYAGRDCDEWKTAMDTYDRRYAALSQMIAELQAEAEANRRRLTPALSGSSVGPVRGAVKLPITEVRDMLYRRESFAVRHAVSFDDPRYSIHGILFEPDGATVATDRHMLARFEPSLPLPDGSEFPAIEGFDATGQTAKPFIVDKDAAERIMKAIPKRQTLPVLEHAALDAAQTDANGHAVFAVTDMESPQTFKPVKADGTFPRYQNVMPRDEGLGEPVTFGVALLKRVLAMAGECGSRHGGITMRLSKKQDGPAEFKIRGEHGKLTVVLMPMHD